MGRDRNSRPGTAAPPPRSGVAERRPGTPARTLLILGLVIALLAGGVLAALGTGLLSAQPAARGPLAVRPSDLDDGGGNKGDGGSGGGEVRPIGSPVLAQPEPKQPRKLPTEKGIAAAIGKHIKRSDLGKHRGVSIRDLRTGELLYAKGGDSRYIPASTTKLFTAAAVLDAYGPRHRFSTRVLLNTATAPSEADARDKSRDKPGDRGAGDGGAREKPGSRAGSRPAQITLVGGGDPLLATEAAWKRRDEAVPGRRYPEPATVEQLAARTAKALQSQGIDRVRLRIDDTLFAQHEAPTWEPQYVPTSVVSPIHALWVNSGRLNWPYGSPRSTAPELTAAEAYAAALRDGGIRVTGIDRGKAPPAKRAERLAEVHSPRLAALVEHMLLISDNDTAEVLAMQVAVARGEPTTFAGAGKAIRAQVRELGVDTTGVELNDGSGLSRDNRIPPNALTDLLATAADPDRRRIRTVLTGMPVGGFSGSLADRFVGYGGSVGVGEEGAGLVRAKTGTLNKVSSLAGVVDTADGGRLAFSLVSDRGAPLDPRIGIDRAVAALTGCGCR